MALLLARFVSRMSRSSISVLDIEGDVHPLKHQVSCASILCANRRLVTCDRVPRRIESEAQ